MEDDRVVPFTGLPKLTPHPDRALQDAIGKLNQVLIIGIDYDGNEYFNSSLPDAGDCLWMMERAKYKLVKIADDLK